VLGFNHNAQLSTSDFRMLTVCRNRPFTF